MSEEDGLPTLEDATPTGEQRMLPQKRSGGQSCFWSWTCRWFFMCYALPQSALGIVMITVGTTTEALCRDSWLPIWLIGQGGSIVIFYTLIFLYNIDHWFKSEVGWLTVLDFLFGLCWWIYGCMWTWPGVNVKLYGGRVLEKHPEIDQRWFYEAEAMACSDIILWFSFFVTVLPFLYVVFTCCLCKLSNKLS